MAHIRKGDKVKIISGDNKGMTATVEAVLVKKGVALLEGVGVSSRAVKPSRLNPMGGSKNIHTGVQLSKLARVEEAKAKAPAAAKVTKKTKETK